MDCSERWTGADGCREVADIGRQVLDGQPLTRLQAGRLFALEDPEAIAEAMVWGQRVARLRHGRRIHLCSIVNAKAGGCPEDCRFCAQSAFHDTAAPRHGFIDSAEVRQAAQEAAANRVNALSLVAAWPELREGPGLEEVCARVAELAAQRHVRPDASLGMIRQPRVAARLREAGLACYHHNLETSPAYFPQICTTHTFDDRLRTLRHAREAGLRICSGGIIGMGESRADRCDLAWALRELEPDLVPLNFLNPIPGTPMAGLPPLPPLEILLTIAAFRLVLPRPHLIIAAGRTVHLRDLQCLMFLAGASGLMVGNYLTTANQPAARDLEMLRDLGLEPFLEAAVHEPASPGKDAGTLAEPSKPTP